MKKSNAFGPMGHPSSPEKPERQLSTNEVAERIGYSDEQVRRLIAQEYFPRAWRLHARGPWRVPEGDVEAFLAKKQRG